MDRNAFHQLLKRYIEGTCSLEESALINQWYELLDNGNVPMPGANEMPELESRIWDRIKDQIAKPDPEIESAIPQRPPSRLWLKWGSVAAALMVAVAGVFLYKAQMRPMPGSLLNAEVKAGLLEQINNTDSIKQVDLEDGSVVMLQPKSILAFPKRFLKNRREVYLEGEAFFKVSKNPARPFFVYNDRLITQVLGTSFNVKIVNDKIVVSVRTGQVAVYENDREVNLNDQEKKNNGVIITPNEKVTYYIENRHFITSLVDAPLLVPDQDNKLPRENFVFDDTPLSKVLEILERKYALEIILGNKDLNNCPFTGDLSQQSLFDKLEIICQAFQADYEIKGTKILIDGGKSCL